MAASPGPTSRLRVLACIVAAVCIDGAAAVEASAGWSSLLSSVSSALGGSSSLAPRASRRAERRRLQRSVTLLSIAEGVGTAFPSEEVAPADPRNTVVTEGDAYNVVSSDGRIVPPAPSAPSAADPCCQVCPSVFYHELALLELPRHVEAAAVSRFQDWHASVDPARARQQAEFEAALDDADGSAAAASSRRLLSSLRRRGRGANSPVANEPTLVGVGQPYAPPKCKFQGTPHFVRGSVCCNICPAELYPAAPFANYRPPPPQHMTADEMRKYMESRPQGETRPCPPAYQPMRQTASPCCALCPKDFVPKYVPGDGDAAPPTADENGFVVGAGPGAAAGASPASAASSALSSASSLFGRFSLLQAGESERERAATADHSTRQQRPAVAALQRELSFTAQRRLVVGVDGEQGMSPAPTAADILLDLSSGASFLPSASSLTGALPSAGSSSSLGALAGRVASSAGVGAGAGAAPAGVDTCCVMCAANTYFNGPRDAPFGEPAPEALRAIMRKVDRRVAWRHPTNKREYKVEPKL